MTAKQILESIADASKREIASLALSMIAGANYRVTWRRAMKTYKGQTDLCEKVVTCLVRAGVSYDAMQSVQAKRESGELPSVNAGRKWGEWLLYPRVATHKGNLYLRFSRPSWLGEIAVACYRNGVPVLKESLRDVCLASEFAERGDVDCLELKLESLVSLERA